MWQRLCSMEMIHPMIGWRWDEHGTHKHTHSLWILWSASRACSKTMHSLFCITSWLPYITLCYIDSKIFSAPGTIKHGSIRLPPRSIASLWGCTGGETLRAGLGTVLFKKTSQLYKLSLFAPLRKSTLSLRKQLSFCEASTGFPMKWFLRNNHRNSIMMMCHDSDLGNASDWLKICFIHLEALPRSG